MMISQSIAQLIRDMSHSVAYTGEYEHIQQTKSLARDMGYALAGFPESEVTEHWDGLYVALFGKEDALKDVFYSEVRDAWVEKWMKNHGIFKGSMMVILLPSYAEMSAMPIWVQRRCIDDVEQWCKGKKMPYLTMKKSKYEVLKEKWGK